jgi:uncharacterized membrane protein YgdD (TMEM256/DUF423 family)
MYRGAPMGRPFLILGALFAGFGVAAGAFGSHGLREVLAPDRLAIFETGVRYQMYHALALLALGVLLARDDRPLFRHAAWSFVIGIILFSGSLYVLALTGMRWSGAITPLGGVAFLVGWVLVVAGALRKPPKN